MTTTLALTALSTDLLTFAHHADGLSGIPRQMLA